MGLLLRKLTPLTPKLTPSKSGREVSCTKPFKTPHLNFHTTRLLRYPHLLETRNPHQGKSICPLGALNSEVASWFRGGSELSVVNWMAKVATIASTSAQIGGALKVGPIARRKTPSELRGEQLKRKSVGDPTDSMAKNVNEMDNGLKNYIDTRISDVYPVKKLRLRAPSSMKENMKENVSDELPNNLKNQPETLDLAAIRPQHSILENPVSCTKVPKDGMVQFCQTVEKCSQSIFRSITEISTAGERSSGSAVVNMDKALKGLVAHDNLTDAEVGSADKLGNHKSGYSGCFCPEFSIPGQKPPFDLTLKTKMQVVCNCSVNWLHRSILSSTYNGVPQFTPHLGSLPDSNCSGELFSSQLIGSKALRSWVYPQSVLPNSVISVLSSPAMEGDFLSKRQLAWNDSFRSLYYMLRKSLCNIFYVCTSQFVVMFIANSCPRRNKHRCSAYISRSTRSLRSLLDKHDVCYLMPHCQSKVEQVNAEDLAELSEIEKQNLGQTRRRGSLSDIDNSPQSLLAFYGNSNVHKLYDFLLNYRSFLTSLSGVDVPVLYSPVPFQNAAISAPEIKCVEMKRPDHSASLSKEPSFTDDQLKQGSSTVLCSSVEIKDAYIPSWIITRLCALMGSEGNSFEASFTTERTSIGLNVALETAHGKALCQGDVEGLQEGSYVLDDPEAVNVRQLSVGFLKGLKYSNSSYTASLSPV